MAAVRSIERRFAAITKGKAGALSVFQKALNKLKAVQARVALEKTKCESNVLAHEAAIENEQVALAYLDQEAVSLEGTATNLAKFVPTKVVPDTK